MKKQIISASLLTLGFLIGATALSAIAGTWTAPTATPPNNNVDAPVNVGDSFQRKNGKFGLGSLVNYSSESGRPLLDVNGSAIISSLGVTGNLLVSGIASTSQLRVTGGSPTYGKVLMSADSSGTASWVATSSLGISGGSTSNFSAVSCPAGQALQTVGINGAKTCVAVQTVQSASCYYGGSANPYSPGALCRASTGCGSTGASIATCQSNGIWDIANYSSYSTSMCPAMCQ